jgi:hypothetical protein
MKRWAPLLFVSALILLAVAVLYFPVPHTEQAYFSPLYSPDGTAVYFIPRESAQPLRSFLFSFNRIRRIRCPGETCEKPLL